MIAILPDIILAVWDTLKEQELFRDLERKEIIKKKRIYEKVFNYFKQTKLSNFVVNENISLKNVPVVISDDDIDLDLEEKREKI